MSGPGYCPFITTAARVKPSGVTSASEIVKSAMGPIEPATSRMKAASAAKVRVLAITLNEKRKGTEATRNRNEEVAEGTLRRERRKDCELLVRLEESALGVYIPTARSAAVFMECFLACSVGRYC